MADLYLLFRKEYRIIHTVYLRIDTQAGIVVIHTMKTVNRIGSYFPAASSGIRVPVFHDLARIPAFGIADRRRYIEVLEQCESGTDRNLMLHTVFPVLYQIGFKQQVVLGLDTVGQTPRIPDGNLLIPFFFTRRFLTLKRIKRGQGDIQVGQSDIDRGVLHSLCDIGGCRNRQFPVEEITGITDT